MSSQRERMKYLMTIKYRAKANPHGNSRLLSVVEAAIKKGDTENAFLTAESYLKKMHDCRTYLKRELPICAELSKWSEKFFVACDLFDKIFEFLQKREEPLKDEILALINKYDSMPAKLSNDVNLKEELKEILN